MAFLAVLAASHPVWADCQVFLDTYNRDPGDAKNDKVLADAATCFQRDKSISAALQADTLLIKYYPNSKYAAAAVRESGLMYEQIAMYDRAADKLEDYAKRYAGERDAGDMLADAIRLRAALGDRAQQIEDTKEWIRMFGVKRRTEAAAAELSLVSVYDGDGAIAQLREFLAHYAAVDPNLTIAAHLDLADRLRAKSCPVHAVDGLCVKVIAVAKPHCGPSTTSIVAVTRTAQDREALAEYRATVALTIGAKQPEVRHAAATARLALADDELEALIAIALPRDLEMSRVASRKRFAQWVEASRKLDEKVDAGYGAVLVEKDAASSVAAAARLGEAAQAMWRALMSSELPKALRAPEVKTAYCDELKEVADPYRARALQDAWTCLAKSRELEAGQEWANVCWRQGAVFDPEPFAPVRELHGTASELALPIALER